MNEYPKVGDLKGLYDEDYARRLHAHEESRRIRSILEHIRLPSHAKVLDVGCGNGPLALVLSPLVGEYHGVDFSEAFIHFARWRAQQRVLANCHFHCCDVIDFCSLHPDMFDVVFALDISEHIPDAEWQNIVASMNKALKPGGQVVLHTPNLDFFIERMKANAILLKQFPEHVAVRTAHQNEAFFERCGFSSVTTEYLPHYNFLRALHPLSRLPGIGPFFAARLLLIAIRNI